MFKKLNRDTQEMVVCLIGVTLIFTVMIIFHCVQEGTIKLPMLKMNEANTYSNVEEISACISFASLDKNISARELNKYIQNENQYEYGAAKQYIDYCNAHSIKSKYTAIEKLNLPQIKNKLDNGIPVIVWFTNDNQLPSWVRLKYQTIYGNYVNKKIIVLTNYDDNNMYYRKFENNHMTQDSINIRDFEIIYYAIGRHSLTFE